VGAVPRRKADREAGKRCFFEKKQQKTFDDFGFGSQERPKPNSQSFLVLFFKKEPLSTACLSPALDISRLPRQLEKSPCFRLETNPSPGQK
jgi:hypothetical protein